MAETSIDSAYFSNVVEISTGLKQEQLLEIDFLTFASHRKNKITILRFILQIQLTVLK